MIRTKLPLLLVGQTAYVAGKFYVVDKHGRWSPKIQVCQTKPPRKKP